MEFVIGDGNLLPGFERHLFGMAAGDRQIFTVTPEDAFGQINDSNVQRVPRKQFDEDAELQVLNGRWGPYIAYQKENYRLAKDIDPKALSYEDCLKIIKDGPQKKKRTVAAKKTTTAKKKAPAKKKVAAKKTTTTKKKTVAKKKE